MQSAASLGDGGVDIVDGIEVSVGEGFVDERPKMLGRLQFRGARGLIDEPDAVRNREVFRRVPAGIVELQHNDAVAAGAQAPARRYGG